MKIEIKFLTNGEVPQSEAKIIQEYIYTDLMQLGYPVKSVKVIEE